MNNDKMIFIYRDARGAITSRHVESVSESDNYIQGLCLTAGELRTFRKDRILEHIEDTSIINDRLNYHIETNPSPKAHRPPRNSLDVCFTGFQKIDKETLIKLAEEAGLAVRKSVTIGLDFLCCGYNAGPKKVEKARSQGILALSEKQFGTMIDTGEIPEEA